MLSHGSLSPAALGAKIFSSERAKEQGMVELANIEFTAELKIREAEFDLSSKGVQWLPLQGMGA